MLENEYQEGLVRRLRSRHPDAIVIAGMDTLRQGFPDLGLWWPNAFWAWLEVKASAAAPKRPNQDYYVEFANNAHFGAFIYPENEDEVLDDLQQAYQSYRQPRVPVS